MTDRWATLSPGAGWIWKPLALFAITRLGIVLVAYLAVPLIADATDPPPYHLRTDQNVLLDVFGSRWDTGFYVEIAEQGYTYEGEALPSVAFFPLLPLLMRALTPAVGDTLVAGVLISNGALLLATLLLYRLVADSDGEPIADRAVWYLLIFPTSFFGSAIYTESLFLLATIGALYLARRSYWESAALAGIAAALTRFLGIIVAPLLLVTWLEQWRTKRRELVRMPLLTLLAPLLVPLGTLGFMFYLQQEFGDPLAFVRGAAAWERVPQSALTTIAGLLERPVGGWWRAIAAGTIPVDNWIDFNAALLFLVLGLVLLSRKRWSEAVFVLLGVLFPISSGLLMSQRRYVWVLFPAFILLARWGERPWIDRAITALSLLGLALFTALFANGYWVA